MARPHPRHFARPLAARSMRSDMTANWKAGLASRQVSSGRATNLGAAEIFDRDAKPVDLRRLLNLPRATRRLTQNAVLRSPSPPSGPSPHRRVQRGAFRAARNRLDVRSDDLRDVGHD